MLWFFFAPGQLYVVVALLSREDILGGESRLIWSLWAVRDSGQPRDTGRNWISNPNPLFPDLERGRGKRSWSRPEELVLPPEAIRRLISNEAPNLKRTGASFR